MTTTESAIAHLLLKEEVTEFLYAEAEMLDERNFEEWLDLLTDDIRYWMPMRRNVKSNEMEREFTREGQDINWFDEGKETLDRRVRQIRTSHSSKFRSPLQLSDGHGLRRPTGGHRRPRHARHDKERDHRQSGRAQPTRLLPTLVRVHERPRLGHPSHLAQRKRSLGKNQIPSPVATGEG